MIIEGRIGQMLLTVFIMLSMFYFVERTKRGMKVSIKPLPPLDEIDTATGRSAEMGRPVHFTPGFSLGGLTNPNHGPGVVAGLSILKRVTVSCIERGARLIVTLAQSESVPIAEAIIKEAYLAKGLEVPPNTVRFISTEQYAYATGVLSTLMEERPAANILVGFFESEALQFAAAGSYIGAFQIGGTPALWQIPYLMAVCDYCLVADEVFAAAVYIDRDPPRVGSLVSSDLVKLILISLVVVFFIAGNLKLNEIIKLLKM